MRYEQHPAFDFYYFEEYRIKPEQVKKFSEDNYKRFISLCKDEHGKLCMTSKINTEWVFRSYSATKMIMAATLLLNNAEYCMSKNAMVSVPYLLYYAALSSVRGFLYASPYTETSSLEKLVNITHNKALCIAPDIIKNHFSRDIGSEMELFLNYLRNQRELFSYKFPASGIRDQIKFDETVAVCGLLAELTELSLYKIQEVYEKNFFNNLVGETQKIYQWMSFDEDVIRKLFIYDTVKITGEELCWIDNEDYYRIGYIERKVKYPTSLIFTMKEGMTEDFFGSWCNFEENNDGNFNPDENWNRIFPIP